jgi:hypothetical protein
MTLKQGPNWGYWDLWRAFGYTGFSVYGHFGRGAFGYRGFWVHGLFGTQAVGSGDFSVYGHFGRGAFGYRGFWVHGLFGTQAVGSGDSVSGYSYHMSVHTALGCLNIQCRPKSTANGLAMLKHLFPLFEYR